MTYGLMRLCPSHEAIIKIMKKTLVLLSMWCILRTEPNSDDGFVNV